MSKDIWHTADEIPDFNKSYVELSRSVQGDLVYSTWGHPNYITKNTIKWCYMDDLLALETDLERTRKALDVAKGVLKEQQRWFGVIRVSLISHLNNEYGTLFKSYDGDPTVVNVKRANDILNRAIEQITTLEQKESAFVHNKIEFPEYNDNLLEEFDKQFFENGQDDDLTETALEQKDVK